MKADTDKARRALNNAVELFNQGRLKAAEGRLKTAIKADPGMVDAHNNLGVLYHHQGRKREALAAFSRAFELAPQAFEAARNVAVVALDLGDDRAALRALQSALAQQPGDRGLRVKLVETCANLGDLTQARGVLDTLLHETPAQGDLLLAQAQLLERSGEHAQALVALRQARRAGVALDQMLYPLSRCLQRARFEADDPDAGTELLACLASPLIESQPLARAAGALLEVRYAGARAARTQPEDLASSGWPADPLLAELLVRAINVSSMLEQWMLADRTALAAHWQAHGGLPEAWRAIAACMAVQCCLNEYIWPHDPVWDTLAPMVESRLAADGDTQARLDALVLGGLFAHPVPTQLADAGWLQALHSQALPQPLASLWRVAVEEPAADAAIAAEFPSARVDDEVSKAVRAQYEDAPYPRWVELGSPEVETAAAKLKRLFPHYDPRTTPSGAATLVAGCGSGHHALLVASQDPASKVVAIDLSIASLSHATRRARELGIQNVEFHHLDLLNVAELGMRFAVIESFGVLHHMREPAAGLAALRSVIEPGGAFKLGLYSHIARRTVNLARERIAALGLSAQPASIRRFRAAILAGEEPQLEALAEAPDLYSTSLCRDLLFHVHEHQFSAPQLGELLAQCDLDFLGFEFSSASVPGRYAEAFPQDATCTDLNSWAQFEAANPNTFARCYLLWAQAPARG